MTKHHPPCSAPLRLADASALSIALGGAGRAPRRLGPRGGAFLASLLAALVALAADRLDEAVEMVLAVIVGDLVAGLDVLHGRDQDLAALDVGLGIGPAGMVDVAGDVAPGRAVDGPAAVELEQVAVVDLVGALVGDLRPPVLDDERALPDGAGGEQAEAGARAAETIGM